MIHDGWWVASLSARFTTAHDPALEQTLLGADYTLCAPSAAWIDLLYQAVATRPSSQLYPFLISWGFRHHFPRLFIFVIFYLTSSSRKCPGHNFVYLADTD